MKPLTLITVPVAFVAGIAFLLLVQQMGWFGVAPQLAEHYSQGQTPGFNDNAESNTALINTQSNTTPAIPQPLSSETGITRSGSESVSGDDVLDSLALLNELEFLRDEMELAVKERESMQTEISSLQESLIQLDVESVQQPTADSYRQAFQNFQRGGQRSGSLERDNLIAAGVDEVLANDIKLRLDADELARLELIDQATREGWRRSDRFNEAIAQQRSERVDLLDELGEDSYDRYLFEAGQSNRVEVSSMLEGSAAQIAGVSSGDVIWNYADVRIYETRQLQNITREGDRGEPVSLLVRRDGSFVPMQISRGPMGVTLSQFTEDPDLASRF